MLSIHQSILSVLLGWWDCADLLIDGLITTSTARRNARLLLQELSPRQRWSGCKNYCTIVNSSYRLWRFRRALVATDNSVYVRRSRHLTPLHSCPVSLQCDISVETFCIRRKLRSRSPQAKGQFLDESMPRHARRHSAVNCAKIAEPIEMPFGLWNLVGLKEACAIWGAHTRNLTNTIEPSICGSDAACGQSTLTTCY